VVVKLVAEEQATRGMIETILNKGRIRSSRLSTSDRRETLALKLITRYGAEEAGA
jgi:hypothetical protein